MVTEKPATCKKPNIVLYAVILLFYIIGASYFSALSFIGLLITIYAIMRGCKQQVVEILLLLAPFAGIMKLSGTFSLYNLLFVVAIFRLLLSDNGKVKSSFVLYFLITVLMLTLGLFSAGIDTALKVVSFAAGVCFVGLVISDTKEYDVRAIIRIFSFGIIVSSLVFLMIDYLPGISRYIISETYFVNAGVRQERFSGLINNPNHYTLSVNLVCMALLSYLVAKKARFIDVVFLIFLLIFGIYSLSKSFVFGLMVSIVISFVYLLRHNPARWVKIGVMGFVVSAIVLQFIDTEYIKTLVDRVLISDSQDINSYTTGRYAIFKMYLFYLSENVRVLILGNGMFNPLERESHNLFIEMIYSFGIVGTLFIVGTYLNLSRAGLKVRKLGRRSILNYAPLLVFLLRGFAINIITSVMFPAYLIIITLFIGENLFIEVD
jgi:hypothetical protein